MITKSTNAVARNLFKLMAYKDGMKSHGCIQTENLIKQLNKQFEGNFKLKFHLAPPLFLQNRYNHTGILLLNVGLLDLL